MIYRIFILLGAPREGSCHLIIANLDGSFFLFTWEAGDIDNKSIGSGLKIHIGYWPGVLHLEYHFPCVIPDHLAAATQIMTFVSRQCHP